MANQLSSAHTTSTWQELVEQFQGFCDPCSHVEENVSPPAVIWTETDSFGLVGRTVLCAACAATAAAEEQAELHTCVDCHASRPRSEGMFWKWYDFYAAQGDEPLFVCRSCWGGAAHRQRRRDDAAARAEELGF